MSNAPVLDYTGREIAVHYVPAAETGRAYKLILQGLEAHPKVRLEQSASDADFVFHHHQAFDSNLSVPRDKHVFIDYSDDPLTIFPVDPLAYFKRSWPYPSSTSRQNSLFDLPGAPLHVLALPNRPPQYHPLPYAVMDEFIVEGELDRDIDVACFLRPNQTRRSIMLSLLQLELSNRANTNVHIGPITGSAREGFDSEYLTALRRSKIVVTAGPDWAEGDSRTWEALANGALVIQPPLLTPVANPLVDGVHIAYFDGENMVDYSTQNVFIDLVLDYVRRPDDAMAIGRAGRDHVLRHHRAVNRVDSMLEVITA